MDADWVWVTTAGVEVVTLVVAVTGVVVLGAVVAASVALTEALVAGWVVRLSITVGLAL